MFWEGYPPEIATWEEEGDIPDFFIDEYEAGLEAEEELWRVGRRTQRGVNRTPQGSCE